MTKKANRFINLLFIAVFLLTAIPMLSLFPALNLTRSAAEERTAYVPTELGLSGGNFNTSSSSFPASPDGFTGAVMDGSQASEIFAAGIVDLATTKFNDAYESDALKLKDHNYTYRGGESFPVTPFGHAPNSKESTTALMINSPVDEIYYAYNSNSLSLQPNRYYEFRVSVMTGDFSSNKRISGAYVRLFSENASDKIDLSFGPIDTSASTLNDGWEEYRFYIESSSFATANVTLSLQLGDYAKRTDILGKETVDYQKAKGVAFFDNAAAYTISKEAYDAIVETSQTKKHTVKEYVDYDDQNSSYNLPFSNRDFENSLGAEFESLTKPNADKVIDTISIGSYDDKKDMYWLGDNPGAPFGSSSVLVFSNKTATYSSLRTSSSFLIERHRLYRLSVWYKAGVLPSESVTTGAVVRVSHEYVSEKGDIPENNVYDYLNFDIQCSGTGDDYYNGWAEAVFFITGSPIEDKFIKLEFLLGTEESPAEGHVFFDMMNLEYLLPQEFSANSGSGTAVSFDTLDFSYGSNSPSIANGNFLLAGDYLEYKYPLIPQGFSGYFAGDNELSNPGSVVLDNEDLITGIISTDDEHFEKNKLNYGSGVQNPYYRSPVKTNMLMVYSATPTAYAYKTPEIVGNAGSYTKISASLYTNLNTNGAGANLVLRRNNLVLSVIKNIHNTDITEYSFFIENSNAANSFVLEIWMGLSDGDKNNTKLSSGHLYIDSVSTAEVTAEDYTASIGDKNTARFTFKDEDFTAFDRDNVTSGYLYSPYTWQLESHSSHLNTNGHLASGGIIDTREITKDSDLSSTLGFTHSNEYSPYVLMLRSPENTAVYMKSLLTHTLDAAAEDSTQHYRVTVRIKTIGIPIGDDLGAMIKLTGTQSGIFKNINTERNLKPHEENDYQEYSFYIKMGSDSADVGFEIWLGNSELSKYYTRGNVFIDNIRILSIGETEFNDSVAIVDEEADLDDSEKTVTNIIKIIMNEEGSSDDSSSESSSSPTASDFPWWGIPSILLGVAILIALIGTLIKKYGPDIWAKFKSKRNKVSYDRENTLGTVHARNVDRIRREKLESLTGSEFDDEELDDLVEGDEDDEDNEDGEIETEKAVEEKVDKRKDEDELNEDEEDLSRFEE